MASHRWSPPSTKLRWPHALTRSRRGILSGKSLRCIWKCGRRGSRRSTATSHSVRKAHGISVAHSRAGEWRPMIRQTRGRTLCFGAYALGFGQRRLKSDRRFALQIRGFAPLVGLIVTVEPAKQHGRRSPARAYLRRHRRVRVVGTWGQYWAPPMGPEVRAQAPRRTLAIQRAPARVAGPNNRRNLALLRCRGRFRGHRSTATLRRPNTPPRPVLAPGRRWKRRVTR